MRQRVIAIGMLAVLLAACGTSPGPKPPAPEVAGEAPSAKLSPPEQALRNRVRKLLVERMGDDARRIRVHVDGTSLWLTGRAPGRWERDQAHDLAHEVPGVTRVDSSGLALE